MIRAAGGKSRRTAVRPACFVIAYVQFIAITTRRLCQWPVSINCTLNIIIPPICTYQLSISRDTVISLDVDECMGGRPCSYGLRCKNKPGSYDCYPCGNGMNVSPDGRSCIRKIYPLFYNDQTKEVINTRVVTNLRS